MLVALIFRVRALEGPAIDWRTGAQLERARFGKALFLALVLGTGWLVLQFAVPG